MGRESRANYTLDKTKAQVSERQLLMACCAVLSRGFWGRMKWLLRGR